jgi:RNA polymerase sigma factor (sigma-70 family)
LKYVGTVLSGGQSLKSEFDAVLKPMDSDVLQALVSNHKRFIGFLASRLPDVDTAEEILQQTLLKAIEKEHMIQDGTNVIAWFYSILRNAVADYYRAKGVDQRKLEGYARELLNLRTADPGFKTDACECFRGLLPTLNSSYAELLEKVDLQERPIPQVAIELQITPNNLMVRLHRARRALRLRLRETCKACAEHGCLNCDCHSKL